MKCSYCGEEYTICNSGMYIIRKAVLPKGCAYRWKKIGLCCEKCDSKGMATNYEVDEKANLNY